MSDNKENQKPSIFLCGKCKTEPITIQRKQRVETEKLQEIKLYPAKDSHSDQKYIVKVGNKTIAFGFKGMSDFTLHKSEDRKNAYISRHEKREKQFWDHSNKENLKTASFWSRFLLWEKPDFYEALQEIEKKTGIKIKYTKNTIDRHLKKLAKSVKKTGEDQDD